MSAQWMKGFGIKSWSSIDPAIRYHSIQNEGYRLKLSNEEASEYAETQPWEKHAQQSSRLPGLLQLLTVALLIALAIVTALYINLRVQLAEPPRLDCGNSLATARARGCHFDQMSKVWMPAECPDYGLEQYLSAASSVAYNTEDKWRFYRNRYNTSEMSVDEMADMADMPIGTEDNRWFTTNGEHIVHCTWLLLRMAHAYHTGQRRDGFGETFDHSKHCATYLMDHALESPRIHEIQTTGSVGFGWC